VASVTLDVPAQGRRQVKQKWGGQYKWVSEGCPLPSRGRVCGYNLKLISTLHNDSIPETPSGKMGWTDVSTPVHPVATPLFLLLAGNDTVPISMWRAVL